MAVKRAKHTSPVKLSSKVFQNMRTIVLLVRENTFRAMHNEAIKHPHHNAVKGYFVSSFSLGASQACFNYMVFALAFWYGGELVKNHGYTVKQMQNIIFPILFNA